MINANELDDWVRRNEIAAQGIIAELVGRLVAAAVPNPNDRRFPRADVINQPGEDGYLDSDVDFLPYVPKGKSFWEFGTGSNPKKKANKDYDNRTAATDATVRTDASLILVTPSSGVHGWAQPQQVEWKADHAARGDWADVRVIDGPRLIEWLDLFPSVRRWLASKMGLAADDIEAPSERWDALRGIGDPPNTLTPDLFIANRHAAVTKVDDIFSGNNKWLQVDTHSPTHVADFIAARIAQLDDPVRTEIEGRCLIIDSISAWKGVAALRDPHILVADFDIDEDETTGIRLLERAKKQGHSVIFAATPGDKPHSNSVTIPEPNEHQIIDALKKAGYSEGRALLLGKRHGGNLNGLLLSMQRLAPTPEWAQTTEAADLIVAELLGGWNESIEGDRAVVTDISGKEYGEWIGSIRKIAQRPDAPLKHRNGVWKFSSRYGGWLALGSRVFDDHLDRVKAKAIEVLSEHSPALELAPDQRYLAGLKGKVPRHSYVLRKGLAETLALIGSYPQALTSASAGKPEHTVRSAVREILRGATWEVWASLNDVLPLLAEAAPEDFLEAVDSAVSATPCPFDSIFSQEGAGFGGQNYMTGLLWALETLAWDGTYLTRVFLLLGALAERDPGGNWGNRAANSLFTIILPWFPQTAASVEKRIAAVKMLLSQMPKAGWELLLNLLPQVQQSSMMTRKPAWRNLIPDDWSEGSTGKDYHDQINAYTTLAVEAAKENASRLTTLVDNASHLSHAALQNLISYLLSESVASMSEEDRRSIWATVTHLVSQHQRFSTAEWALSKELVDQFSEVADHLSPESAMYKTQRLFTDRDFDLYEQNDNFEEEYKKLDHRRQQAVKEVYDEGGISRVLEMVQIVKSPVKLGIAFGGVGSSEDDKAILPELLGSGSTAHSQFVGGYIWAKFRRVGWDWLHHMQVSQWESAAVAELLSYFPFTSETWSRAAELLGTHELEYWSKARVNPFEAGDDLDIAVGRLLDAGRIPAAIDCVARRILQKQPYNPEHALRALHLVGESAETVRQIDQFEIVQIIKALQQNTQVDPQRIGELEWMYLPLLDDHAGTRPVILEQQLADDPHFFCQIVQTIFPPKSRGEGQPSSNNTEPAAAANAYRLLHQWKRPPGSRKDGTFDADALNEWFEEVKKICEESGHLDVALQRVGHVLRYYPPDPDGFFMHRAIARLLDRKDATEVRIGFSIEIYNSRGAYFVDPKGGPERALADQYRREAEQADLQGYARLAATLQEVAKDYDREAEHNIVAARMENDL